MRSSPARATAASEEPGAAEPEALVLNVQRMSTEDGPGIRSTVFVKGCTLACRWCHNPESISHEPELVWQEWRCVGCGSCEGVCEHGALEHAPSGILIDRSKCQACGACARACPAGALELLGTPRRADALVAELAHDRPFFECSGGGVTLSGGEPALRPAFAEAFCLQCREAGLHVAVDTCGAGPAEAVERSCRHADLVLYDLKEIDPERHRAFTGRGNAGVLENARRLAERARPGAIWIRTPLIPGATARPDNLEGLGAFIAGELGEAVGRWELLAFNKLCAEQYRRLGREWAFADATLLESGEIEGLRRAAARGGVAAERIFCTGATR
ncbi:MAG: glycyl-radical enzyme activating protein [Deltaproteobacteria bacterium]|nr:glycyl-radical enzyme activating protein [Deltaproteobacteria bacterium]